MDSGKVFAVKVQFCTLGFFYSFEVGVFQKRQKLGILFPIPNSSLRYTSKLSIKEIIPMKEFVPRKQHPFFFY